MKHARTIIAIALVSALAGCETPRQTQTAVGTGAGVATGAAIGAMVGGGKGAAIGAGVGGGIGAAVGYNWGAIKDKLGMATKETPAVQVSQVSDGSLKVNVPGSVSFASGTATLDQRLFPTLERVASTLNEYPQTSVTVVGYTDSVGSSESNRDLARRRATAVADYLAQHGVVRSRIMIDSRGEEEPIASNDTEAGRAQNRRVEMLVKPIQQS